MLSECLHYQGKAGFLIKFLKWYFLKYWQVQTRRVFAQTVTIINTFCLRQSYISITIILLWFIGCLKIYVTVVTWTQGIFLICMPKARGPQARGLREYISGKSGEHMLQVIYIYIYITSVHYLYILQCILYCISMLLYFNYCNSH